MAWLNVSCWSILWYDGGVGGGVEYICGDLLKINKGYETGWNCGQGTGVGQKHSEAVYCKCKSAIQKPVKMAYHKVSMIF